MHSKYLFIVHLVKINNINKKYITISHFLRLDMVGVIGGV